MRFSLTFCLFISSAFLLSTKPYLPLTSIESSEDRALFFAVNSYKHMDNLKNPIQNAKDIAAELHKSYGFQTEVIKNPSLDDIDDKLAEYQRKYTNGTFSQKGQLLIFFSGHGVAEGNNGYFMTKNANPDRPQRTAMEYDYYRNEIDEIPCQHIMVAIDACHSATFDPHFSSRSNRRYGRPGEATFDRIRANHKDYKARCFWTSDGVGKQTPDKSNFAYKFLEGLRAAETTTGYVRSSVLYSKYLEEAAPKPGGGRFGKDEPNACFLFFKEDFDLNFDPEEEPFWQFVQQQNTKEGYAFYQQRYPKGKHFAAAKSAIEKISTKIILSPSTNAFAPEYGMVFVKGGTFKMGGASRDAKPRHKVTLKDFYIAKYEVTQKLWRFIMGKDPDNLGFKGCDECPVERVSWNDIQLFLTRLNKKTDKKYRLPTEAEWEYAARGGQKSKGYKYAGSDNLEEVAWYDKNSYDLGEKHKNYGTNPVGQKKANELGLYDMTGNVWERVQDKWHSNYKGAPGDGSAWGSGFPRVYRGGSWNHIAGSCRVVYRTNYVRVNRFDFIGFRLVSSL